MKRKLFLLIACLLIVLGLNAQTPITIGNYISTPGQADSPRNNSIFSYTGAGTPWNGSLLTIGGFNVGSYPLQINSDYGPHGGKHLSFRTKNDDGGGQWNSWYEIYHSGNLNRNDVDFSAKTIFINSSWNLPAIQFGGGSFLRSNGTYVVLQQNGPDNDKTFYIEGFSNILKDQNVVYHAGNLNRLDVDFNTNHLTTTRQGIGIEGSGFGNSWGIGKDNTMGLYFFEGTVNQYRMIIKDGGNVLIGKTTQTGTGTRYKLDVEGPIRASEIVVNTTGADFVFEPTYKLRTLNEVEAFIKQNKHLPEIAPAKEMQENGLSAGELQMKLLQKVEELTLYVIELKKENEDLKKENKDIKQNVSDLKKEIRKN